MKQISFSENDLQKIIDTIKRVSGNDLSNKKDLLKDRIINFTSSHKIDNIDNLNTQISYASSIRQEFLNLITINETYFYRELGQLNSVVNYVNTLDANVRILCAPCSSGEEVYSLAILAKSIGIDKNHLSIVGVDINSEVIECCEKGIYGSRALQNLNEAQKATYFTNINDKFQIKKNIMSRIDFKVVNIFDNALFRLGMFDIILSRNMMIYFDDTYRQLTIERFHKVLRDHGRLYVGHADLVPYSNLYKKITHFGTSYYEKL